MLLLLGQEKTKFFIEFRDLAGIDGEARNRDGRKNPSMAGIRARERGDTPHPRPM